MTTDSFLKNFGYLADAANGIQQLRNLILNLAVQGLLVSQDYEEESADKLLELVISEHKRLASSGDAKKYKAAEEISDIEKYRDSIPHGWKWVRLTSLGEFAGGGTPSKRNPDYWDGEIPWVSPKDMKVDKITDSGLSITEAGRTASRLQAIPIDSILIVARSGILRRMLPVAINKIECTVNQDLKVIIPYLTELSPYLQLLLKGHESFILKSLVKGGMTVQSLKYSEFEQQPFPIPPLLEQHRIVAKVDELMSLCDELEQRQQKRASVRSKLNKASLHSLPTATDDDAFQTAWAHIRHNFDTLYTTPESIQDLRQSILQLAVQGKLVPQDPSDEPARHLLAAVVAEKEQLLRENKIKRVKPLPEINPDEIPYKIPEGWIWVRLDDIGYTNIGLTYSPSDVSDTGIPVLRSNNIKDGKLDLSDLKRVNKEVKKSVLVHEGDLLICARNGSRALVGKTALITKLSEVMAFGAFMAIYRSRVNNYLLYFINSPLFRRMIDEVNTMTINQITQKNLRSTILPLPPLQEQKRIVAEIDRLMALCDELESKLTESQFQADKLMDAIVHNLTNGSTTSPSESTKLTTSSPEQMALKV